MEPINLHLFSKSPHYFSVVLVVVIVLVLVSFSLSLGLVPEDKLSDEFFTVINCKCANKYNWLILVKYFLTVYHVIVPQSWFDTNIVIIIQCCTQNSNSYLPQIIGDFIIISIIIVTIITSVSFVATIIVIVIASKCSIILRSITSKLLNINMN